MRKIVTQVPAKTVVSYQCEVCKTKYPKAREAKACEARTTEEQKFSVGDTVVGWKQRTCANGSSYIVRGKVVKVIGPMLMDADYAARRLDGTTIGWHVFQYEVAFTCPQCHERQKLRYYLPELNDV